MTFAFRLPTVLIPLRAATIGLAALVVPFLGAQASAAPARPGPIAAVTAPIETVAARRVYRSKAVGKRRVARRGLRGRDAAILGAIGVGVIGAIMADQRRRDRYEEQPYYGAPAYGRGGYGGYGGGQRYIQQGQGYDRRYWRGGPPPGQVAPAPLQAPVGVAPGMRMGRGGYAPGPASGSYFPPPPAHPNEQHPSGDH